MTQSRRVLFVDGSSGASGDMLLGALVDLGVPTTVLRSALRSLPIDGWTLRARRVARCSLAGRKVDVRVKQSAPGRGWRSLQRIIQGAELPPGVGRRALAIFRRLIEAEAEAHGRSVDQVHLHEAGGTDAIVDVVGVCVGIAELGVDRIVVSPLTTGHGEIVCAHGRYPVPAPATLLLMRGYPVRSGDRAFERLTPTGAAILSTIADEWSELPAMRPLKVGYGAGGREFDDLPNMLRLVLGETDSPAGLFGEKLHEVAVLECTIDDATPQALAFAADRLRDLGALELFVTPVHMKKGRTGQLLTALCRPGKAESLARTLLIETSTLGLRVRLERRVELERVVRRVRTAYGAVRIKAGRLDGEEVQVWPEYDDCVALAHRHGVPLVEIQRAALESDRKGPSASSKRKRAPARRR